MKKVQKLAQTIDKDTFIDFYSSNTREATANHFNITVLDVKQLAAYYGFKKTKAMISDSVKKFYQGVKLIAVHKPGDTRYIRVKEEELDTYLKNGYLVGYEQCDEIRQQKILKSKQTKLERYGNENYNNIEKNYNTKLERYGDKNYNNKEQIKQTQFNLYGGYAFTDKEKYEATMLQRYGVRHNWASFDEKLNGRATMYEQAGSKQQHYKNVLEKGKQTRLELYGDAFYSNSEKAQKTMLQKYGVPYYCITNDCQVLAHTTDAQQKRILTKIKNNSWHNSQPEIDVQGILENYFGKDNVYTQYNNDKRYPFACDFYLKSLDLFIELNLHPTHGLHPFDPTNKEDLRIAELLKANPTQWNKTVLDVWTVRDVKKLEMAKINNLKYLTIYPNDTWLDIINIIKEHNF